VNSETWKTPEEFIAAGQAKTLYCGISGTGSSSHVIGFALEDSAKFKPVNWVPFGGGSESVTQLAGKHIDFAITTTSSTLSLVAGGRIRPLLIFSNEKDPMYPNAPLPKEVGLNITAMPIVRGIVGPPGLPPQLVDILEKAFFKAVQDPGFVAYAQKVRLPISPINHTKFLEYTVGADKEITKWIDKIKGQVK